jgi:pimeloyl-ACP methyl ester carboxylesterase
MPDVRHAPRPPTLVLLPAMLCNEDLYRPQIEGLRDLVEPVTLTVAAASMTDAVKEVLQQAPPRFLLAGTSYGGSLALEVVAQAPARVVGLWLMGCNPGPHSDPTAALLRNDRVRRGEFNTILEELAAAIAYEGGPHAVEATSNFRRMAQLAGPEIFLLQNTTLLSRPDRRADLERIACPTLLVWGREDRLSAVQTGIQMSGLIRGARLMILDECGHLPTLEQPEATVTLVRDWLGSISL